MGRKTQSEIALLVERYIADLRIFSVKKESTIACCRSCLMHLIRYMEQSGRRKISEFDMQEFYDFLRKEKTTKTEKTLKSTTMKNIICEVTLFIRWYQQKNPDRQCLVDCDMPRALTGTKQEYRTDALSDDVLMQIQADLTGVEVVRPVVTETTAFGAACLAALAVGFWDSLDSIRSLWKSGRTLVILHIESPGDLAIMNNRVV